MRSFKRFFPGLIVLSVLLVLVAQFGSGSITQATLPGGTNTAVQFNNAGLFGGDPSKFQNIQTALPTPSAPVITQGGTPGSTMYSYQISWFSNIGTTANSAVGATSTGNATLSATNFNIVTAGSCPPFANGFTVYRFSDGSGLIGQSPCGTPFHDTGQAGNFVFPVGDSSAGVYTGQAFRQGFLGNKTEQYVIGSALQDFSNVFLGAADPGGPYEFNYHGSTSSLPGTGIVQMNVEATDAGVTALFLNSATSSGGFPSGIFSTASNLGSSLVASAFGVSSVLYTAGTGNITDGVVFFGEDEINLSSGTFTNSYTAFQSTVTPGAGKFSFDDKGGGGYHTKPLPFASLVACAAGTEGRWYAVNNSNTAVWGATIAGGGTNHVLAYCDGTNWTVMAK